MWRSTNEFPGRGRVNRFATILAVVAVVLVAGGAALVRSTVAGADVTVTPTAPTFTDDSCKNFLPTGASYTIPSTTGVDYLVNGAIASAGVYNAADGATVTVTAQAEAGFVLTGTVSFTHAFSATPSCATHVTATAPTFNDDICTTGGGSTGASYVVPAMTGVDYLVNGVKTAAGTYSATDGTKVTILARAQAGFALTGASSFSHSFASSCLTSVTPNPPVFADDVCSGAAPAGASYLIPTTAGVDYLVDGVKTAAGSYPATDGSTVTVTTQAQAGFALAGTTSFTRTFAATPVCTTSVSPTAPVFTEDVCSGFAPAGAAYTIPATTGVDYLVNGVKTAAGTYPATDGSTLTVTTQAQTGFALTGTVQFTHTFAAAPVCTQTVTPAAPSFHDDVCSGGAKTQATYTIPSTVGVDYLVNGVKTAAGTYDATDGSTLTVATQSQAGFVLAGTTSFTHTFGATPTCTVAVAPAVPSFSDSTCSGGAPSQALYTIPSSTGVGYLVNGISTAAGTYNAADGATITITAQPKPGYTLTGTTSFTHTFAVTPTCTTSVCQSSGAWHGGRADHQCWLCKGWFSERFSTRFRMFDLLRSDRFRTHRR